MTEPIGMAALMCHAPIVVPQVGGRRSEVCAQTTTAMREVARRLVAGRPDVLVVLSPHSPRQRTAWGISEGPRLMGDLGRFGAPEVAASLPTDAAAVAALRAAATAEGLQTWSMPGRPLDHGAMVPLFFVVEAGWDGPTVLISLPYPDTGTEPAMGRAIRAAAEARGQRWVVLASGDMSHRLQEGAPSGYHPRARDFDRALVDVVTTGDLRRLSHIDPGLRELAAEDAVDTLMVAGAAVGWQNLGHETLCYEGPFGVGYMEAVLYRDPAIPARGEAADEAVPPYEAEALLAIARQAIAAHLEGQSYEPAPLPPPLDTPRGCFVTLWTKKQSLRGCIGHILPVHGNVADEIAECAVLAATQDPRFPALRRAELDETRLEISLLSPPEAQADTSGLDPHRYGVVVSCGFRRGVLLPNVRGVDTVGEQLKIALRKGGIGIDEKWRVERFTVDKISEEGAP